ERGAAGGRADGTQQLRERGRSEDVEVGRVGMRVDVDARMTRGQHVPQPRNAVQPLLVERAQRLVPPLLAADPLVQRYEHDERDRRQHHDGCRPLRVAQLTEDARRDEKQKGEESRGGEHTRTPRRVVAQRGEAAAPLLVGGDRPRAQGRITMTALPLLPSTVAVMVTVPVRFVFTRPFLSTSAVRLSLDFHITFLLRSVPSAARTSAVSWTSVPLRASVNAGVTMT